MTTAIQREAQAGVEKEETAEENEAAEKEQERQAELARRVDIGQSDMFAQVRAEVGVLIEACDLVLDGETNHNELMRAQGGKQRLRELLARFDDALRTTPSQGVE